MSAATMATTSAMNPSARQVMKSWTKGSNSKVMTAIGTVE
jgi:hypothetical protein